VALVSFIGDVRSRQHQESWIPVQQKSKTTNRTSESSLQKHRNGTAQHGTDRCPNLETSSGAEMGPAFAQKAINFKISHTIAAE